MLDVLPFACMIVMGRRDDDRGASMQRRSFITGLLALAAGGTGTLAAFEAAAAPATQSIVPLLPNAAAEDAAAMAAPDGTPIESAQNRNSVHWHHRNRRHRHHRRHVRRRRVCRIHFDRWGRRVQRCHWVWG